uniref:Fucolectin tachylectin-4 pentraxin-1 domain-containing protein n=1 Tax=Biomphalaria glabrata TaxID=6526 RepID=A0A2C9LZP6_BIOGL
MVLVRVMESVSEAGLVSNANIVEDLTLLENTIISPNIDLLTDRDDTTCLNVSIQTINITFNITYVFTWIRLTVKDPASLPGFTVEFSTSASLTPKIECLNQKYFLVDNATLDIQCDLTEAIQTVIITGTGQTSLCSLYINGGRNVALKQNTSQTSDHMEPGKGTFDASRAVDGNTNSIFFGGLSCTHTNTTDYNPKWNVVFQLSEISRYVIYNRDECPAGSWELNCRTCKQSCPNNCHWDDGSCNEVCFGAMDPPGCKKGLL